jgi:hypothetical protein
LYSYILSLVKGKPAFKMKGRPFIIREVAQPVSVGDRQLALALPYEKCYNVQVGVASLGCNPIKK